MRLRRSARSCRAAAAVGASARTVQIGSPRPMRVPGRGRSATQSGHWRAAPQDWPEQALEQKQFLQALEKCLAMLPARTSQVFLMREHLGLATAEICKELGITATHCWVLLYRARMALRECLQLNWFGTR